MFNLVQVYSLTCISVFDTDVYDSLCVLNTDVHKMYITFDPLLQSFHCLNFATAFGNLYISVFSPSPYFMCVRVFFCVLLHLFQIIFCIT